MSEHKADIDEVILEWYIQELVGKGWCIVNRTATTALVARTRKWNLRGLLAGAVLLAVGIVFSSILLSVSALLVFTFVAVDYVRQRPTQNTVTTAQAREAARLLEGEATGRAEQI